MPELFDLQQRVIADNRELQDIIQRFGDRVMPLYKKDPFMAGQGEWKTLTEADTQTYGNEQPEGTNPTMISYGIGRTLNYTYVDYGNATTVTERAIRNNKYREVFEQLISLPRMLNNRRYLDGVHQLTFGNVDSYTNMDGRVVSMLTVDGLRPFYSAHTLPHSSATWSNLVTGNPIASKAGILAAELIFKTQILDGFGVRKVMEPTHLITSDDPETVYNVRQFMGSTSEVGQANPNVINALNKYTHVVLPLLDSDANGAYDSTKAKWWILGRFGTSDGVDMRYSEAEGIQVLPPHKDEMNGNVTSRVKGGWVRPSRKPSAPAHDAQSRIQRARRRSR
jgi:hypothetical protein